MASIAVVLGSALANSHLLVSTGQADSHGDSLGGELIRVAEMFYITVSGGHKTVGILWVVCLKW